MDIEYLKKKRQLNVQEQNALEKHRIYQEASYWRKNGIPKGLTIALEEKGVDTAKSILLQYEQDFPGVSTDEGIILTPDARFYEFEMDLDENRSKVIELYLWDDVTSKVEINEHKPGTGSTWGFLALEVLHELNRC
ncbi:hypothetical protein [uncultured Thalassolituus sp.]|uniref:hypothetical protein n=1 Tax=uncultured Thalassolituus sp. TaxID=285273 RepID=UPI00262D1FFD|nr:hypothetical protein [uncultured Thalassolituus sp.]